MSDQADKQQTNGVHPDSSKEELWACIEKLSRQRDAAMRRFDRILNDLNDVAELEREVHVLRSRIEQTLPYQQELERLRESQSQWEQERLDWRKRYLQWEDVANALVQKHQSAEMKNRRLRNLMDSLAGKADVADRALQRISRERSELGEKLEMTTVEKDALSETVEMMQAESIGLERRLLEVETERDLLENKMEQASESRESLREEHDKLLEKTKRLAKEQDALTQEKDRLIEERERLLEEKSRIEEEKASLEQDRDALRNSEETLSHQTETLKEEINATQTERDLLVVRIDELKANQDGLETMLSEREQELNRDLEKTVEELDALRERLQEAEADQDQLRSRFKLEELQWKTKLDETLLREQEAREQISQLAAWYDESCAELQRHEAVIDQSRDQLQDLHQKMDQLQSQNHVLDVQRNALRANLDERDKTIAELTADRDAWKRKSEQVGENLVEYRQENETLTTQCATLQEQLSQAEVEAEEFRAEREKLAQQEDLELFRERLLLVKRQRDDYLKRLEKLELDVDRLQMFELRYLETIEMLKGFQDRERQWQKELMSNLVEKGRLDGDLAAEKDRTRNLRTQLIERDREIVTLQSGTQHQAKESKE